MNKIAELTGNSFNELIDGVKDAQMTRYEDSKKLSIRFRQKDLKAIGWGFNPYMIHKVTADCISIQKEMDITVDVPPLRAARDEIVRISSDEDRFYVEYAIAGIRFSSIHRNLALKQPNLQTLEEAKAEPAVQMAFNINYMIRALNSLRKGFHKSMVDKVPVLMSISGTTKPIILSTGEGNERFVLPVRSQTVMKNSFLVEDLVHKSTPQAATQDKNNLYCPHCKESLSFLKLKRAKKESVRYCPYCGQALVLDQHINAPI